MMSWLSSWMMHPALFAGGVAAIAAPILIHLLNRQRFKTIDWAAMEFLLQAQRRNRYRIAIEDLILLLLRCLAVALLAMLVARPFLPRGLTTGLVDTASFERIVLLDDSLSMRAETATGTAFDQAKSRLIDFVRSLSDNGTDNSLTLLLTSNPDQPLFVQRHVDDDSVDEIVKEIEDLSPTDLPARLDAALLALRKSVAGPADGMNRVVYVVGDMRRRDWQPDRDVKDEDDAKKKSDVESQAVKTLRQIADQVAACYLVDSSTEETANLIVGEVACRNQSVVAGLETTLDVTVHNVGEQDAEDVRIQLAAADAIFLEEVVEVVPAREKVTVPFTFTLDPELAAASSFGNSTRITVEVESNNSGEADTLPADSSRFFAARVIPGIPVLIVDGDPAAVKNRRESRILKAALAPGKENISGIKIDIITENQFEHHVLDDYQVVLLCNVYRMTLQRMTKLEKWVQRGGGLVWMLGDQLDQAYYNQKIHARGSGLLPVRLTEDLGDSEREKWVRLEIADPNHPVLRVFAEEGKFFLDQTKVFRWWSTETTPAPIVAVADETESESKSDASEAKLDEKKRPPITVAARFSDPDGSPALVETVLGAGRVMVFATTPDSAWTDWPKNPSFLVAMQEMIRYMAPASANEGNQTVGNPLSLSLDLTEYDRQVVVSNPDDTKSPLRSQPGGESDVATLWRVDHDQTADRGFYEFHLVCKEIGEESEVLFAANVEPTEGDLRPAETEVLLKHLDETRVQIVDTEAWKNLTESGAKLELWMIVLIVVVCVLCLEQTLAWAFGRRR